MLKKIFHATMVIINVILAIVMIGLLIIAIFRPSLFEEFIKRISVVIQTLGNRNYLIGFGTAFIESFPVIGVLVPGQNIMLVVGGFFGVNNLTSMILVTIAGALAGNYVGYLLGVKRGNIFFAKYGDWFGIGKVESKYIKSGIQKHGWRIVVVGKFHNTTRAFVPFIAGSMNMLPKKFNLYNVIGSVLRATSIILLGVVFVNTYQIILKYINYVIIGLLIILISYIWIFKKEQFKQYLKEKTESM